MVHSTYAPIKLNNGTQIPSPAFGTGTALYSKDAKDQVLLALKTGFRHIDAAQMYANEESVGAAIKESGIPRDQLYVTTKYGGGDIKESFNTSLKKLGLDWVDLYLIHSPELVKDQGGIAGSWKILEELQAQGHVKSIGVSNYRVKDLEELLKTAKVKPAVNQIEYHAFVLDKAEGIQKLAGKHGIILEAYGPLSPLIRKSEPELDEAVKKIAKKYGGTEGQALLNWVRSQNIVVVTTSSKQERLEEYLRVAELPNLEATEIKEISDIGKKYHYRNFMDHMDQ